jgi:hypothetical protein
VGVRAVPRRGTRGTVGDDRRAAGEGAARACDLALDATVVAFAVWTLVYQLCAVARVGAAWAAGAGLLLAAPGVWLVLRRAPAGRPDDGAPAPEARRAPGAQRHDAAGPTWRPWPARRGRSARLLGPRPLGAATAATALVAAGLFAFAPVSWGVVSVLWVLSAALAVAWTTARLEAEAPQEAARGGVVELAVVAGWAVGLAVLALLVVNPDRDDAYYVHLSTWIAAHGRFPLRDVVFSDEVLPALYYPPAPSFEALAGTVARLASLEAPTVVYLVVPALGTALSVLATWRLLRSWGVRMAGLALTVAMLFLLFHAEGHRAPGAFFLSRMWQGKVLFATILIPLLLVWLHAHAARPSRRGLALLAAGGVAGVGLTTSAIFVMPVIAAGGLAPLALRAPRAALAGLVATAGYPTVAAVVALAVGGRQAGRYTVADADPGYLTELHFGEGVLALLGVAAVLLGPPLLRRASAGRMLAATALLLGLLFAPGVPEAIFELTELGRVLWRLLWALPVAALLGALVDRAAGDARPALLALLLAALVCAAAALAGTPLWAAQGVRVADRPALKRAPAQLDRARRILAQVRPGDVVLAPRPVSQTILVLSGTVTTVNPRWFFTKALRGVPEAHVPERLLLGAFAERAPGPIPVARRGPLRRALRVVGVDLACVRTRDAAGLRLVGSAGYGSPFAARDLRCLRARADAGERAPRRSHE